MEKDNQFNKDESKIPALPTPSIFQGDHYYSYIHKKAEKIGAAIYMVSDFFLDDEPIKTSLRSSALSLIDMALSLNTTSSSERNDLNTHLIREALLLISYSDIATRVGIESVMNNRILRGELEQFIKTIEERAVPQKLGRDFVLSEDFIKDEPFVNRLMSDKNPRIVSKPTTQERTTPKPKHKGHSLAKEEKSSRKSERQEAIIGVIRSKGELSIKDLTGVIKGCSEKTIQRELIVLVESGILNKVGERRWSRYSLQN